MHWCTLCYADLRPVAMSAPAAVASDAYTDVGAVAEPPGTVLEMDAVQVAGSQRDVGASAPQDQASWPCGRCGAVVPLEQDSCPDCGGGFMAANVPNRHGSQRGIDAIGTTPLSSRTKAIVMVSGAIGVGVVLLLGTVIVALFL